MIKLSLKYAKLLTFRLLPMIDTHCHIDLYPNPSEVTAATDRARIFTVIVTNLPSAFDRAWPHVQGMKNIRLALGLHPLVAQQHLEERERFNALVDQTSYIGEIGLDFSREGIATKELQIESFRFVLQALRGKPKFITLHSRQAESTVLDLLIEENRSPVVFHWYTGTLEVLRQAVTQGHYFSINPAMINSAKGKKIIAAIPQDRVLTESDGPFVKVRGKSALPADVAIVEDYLANIWQVDKAEVGLSLKKNLLELLRPIQTVMKQQ